RSTNRNLEPSSTGYSCYYVASIGRVVCLDKRGHEVMPLKIADVLADNNLQGNPIGPPMVPHTEPPPEPPTAITTKPHHLHDDLKTTHRAHKEATYRATIKASNYFNKQSLSLFLLIRGTNSMKICISFEEADFGCKQGFKIFKSTRFEFSNICCKYRPTKPVQIPDKLVATTNEACAGRAKCRFVKEITPEYYMLPLCAPHSAPHSAPHAAPHAAPYIAVHRRTISQIKFNWIATVLETKATGQSEKESGQDKGKTKRARLDETLSPRGKPKKTRLTPAQDTRSTTYAGAASADKPKAELVITSATGYITKETAAIVEKHLDDAFIATARKQIMTVEGPIFMRRPTYYDGSLRLYSEDQEAVEWTVGVCSELDLPGVGKLTVIDAKDIPKMVRCGICLPHEHDGDQVLIGVCLRLGNPWAQVERWRVHTIIPQGKATFVVSIPNDIVQSVLERKRRLGYRLGAVYLKFQDAKGRFVDTPIDSPNESGGMRVAAAAAKPVVPPSPNEETSQAGPVEAIIIAFDFFILAFNVGISDYEVDTFT
ncbi:unnamed protein product, partial [Leptidea sinapis]